MLLYILNFIRENDGDSYDDVDVGFVELEETTHSLQTSFLLVQFNANTFIV